MELRPIMAAIRLLIKSVAGGNELPGSVNLLTLRRLSRQEISDLSVAVVGEVPHQARLIDLLHNETDGNALFIVEVLRVLADEAGGLRAIAKMKLPTQVFAGGITAVTQRRLSQIPESILPCCVWPQSPARHSILCCYRDLHRILIWIGGLYL